MKQALIIAFAAVVLLLGAYVKGHMDGRSTVKPGRVDTLWRVDTIPLPPIVKWRMKHDTLYAADSTAIDSLVSLVAEKESALRTLQTLASAWRTPVKDSTYEGFIMSYPLTKTNDLKLEVKPVIIKTPQITAYVNRPWYETWGERLAIGAAAYYIGTRTR